MNDKQICILIILINIMCSIAYFVFVKIKAKDTGKAIAGGLVILVTFGFGGVYLLLSSVYYNLISRRFEKQVSIEELSFRKHKKSYYSIEDVELARNRVPLEEAMIVSDRDSARRSFLNVLKEDYRDYIRVVNEAVLDDDSEISHYAATAIVDTISKFKKNFEIQVTKKLYDEKFVIETATFLKLGILAEYDVRYYARRLEAIAADSPITDNLIFSMVDLYLYLHEEKRAEEWVKKIEKSQEKNLCVYKTYLKFYYQTEQYQLFMRELDELKKSKIALDHQTLELIRMYM